MRYFIAFTAALCNITYLYQKDFDDGTYIISKPGHYCLGENISFNPNPSSRTGVEPCRASFPLPHQFEKYDPRAFGIGFFAAISVQCDHVKIDLNGFTLEQSLEHSLLQKFYSHIELADQPFVPSEGPHDFGNTLLSASHCEIFNGTFGRSSHHAIHGNNNKHINIHDLIFENYELAAVSLNGAHHIQIERCTASSRIDVPVLGIFSSARFILRYVDFLSQTYPELELWVQGNPLRIQDIQTKLCDSLNAVHSDVLLKGRISYTKHPKEFHLFHNRNGVVDGNCYSFLFNHEGNAVGGFSKGHVVGRSSDIRLSDVRVKRAIGNIIEVPALKSYGKQVIDPVGAVFQIRNKTKCGKLITIDKHERYLGNVVSNAQAIVAKAIHHGIHFGHLDVSRNNITPHIVEWIESFSKLNHFHTEGYFCNGDAMFHVNKGVNVFRFDSTDDIQIDNCKIEKAMNLGNCGNCDLCYYNQNEKSHPDATLSGYNGANLRGFSFADVTNFQLWNCSIDYLESKAGTVVGFDVFNASRNGELSGCIAAGLYVGEDAKYVCAYNPNRLPEAYELSISSDCQDIVNKT